MSSIGVNWFDPQAAPSRTAAAGIQATLANVNVALRSSLVFAVVIKPPSIGSMSELLPVGRDYHMSSMIKPERLYALLMLGKDYERQDCSLARALEAIGERWTLLIIRDA